MQSDNIHSIINSSVNIIILTIKLEIIEHGIGR